MENGHRSTVQRLGNQQKQSMTPAGILRTLRGLHWFLLYVLIAFAFVILRKLIIGWISSPISDTQTYIYVSQSVVFNLGYFITLGYFYCGTLLWLRLSHQRWAASWGWRVFAPLEMIISHLDQYYCTALRIAALEKTGSHMSISMPPALLAYGFLLTLIPLTYYIWAIVRSRGGKQAAGGADTTALQSADDRQAAGQQAASDGIHWAPADDQQANRQQAPSGGIYWVPADDRQTDRRKAKSGGMRWFSALLLTLGAAFIFDKIIGWVFSWTISNPNPSIAVVMAGLYYVTIAAVLLGFLLWVGITNKRYALSGNWQVGSSVLFVESITFIYSLFMQLGERVVTDPFFARLHISEAFVFPVWHLIIALILACLPLLYLRKKIREKEAAYSGT